MTETVNPRHLALSDKITVDNANAVLLQLLTAANDSGADDAVVHIDLHRLNYCDSAGVAALIAAKSQLAQRQKTLTYLNPPQQLLELTHFLKVDSLLFDRHSSTR
ncbi:MAG: hypothetical protein CSA47_01885 [Gammaproteobacteria bacterium]|nr:MAG: hypothetical protein CSA47_01885 [Gammaproteobacteria bacterium]